MPFIPPVPQLRVGLASDSPPFSFRQGGRLVGIDLDLGSRLGEDMGRSLLVFDLPREDLIPALLDGRVDIVMSGMAITPLRELRVGFGEPYLESGLGVLVRRREGEMRDRPRAALEDAQRIGVTKGTNAEAYVREQFRGGQIFAYTTNGNAIADLDQRRLDAFVADAATVAWFASENEGALGPLLRPLLDRFSIGWAFRPDDRLLRAAANDSITRWKKDGTLEEVLERWLPRWQARTGTEPIPATKRDRSRTKKPRAQSPAP